MATCDRWDIGGVSTAVHPDTGLPTVFVYDGHPGGAGFADRGYARIAEWLGATRAAVTACECAAGCPSCVYSPKCGNGNDPLDKAGGGRSARRGARRPLLTGAHSTGPARAIARACRPPGSATAASTSTTASQPSTVHERTCTRIRAAIRFASEQAVPDPRSSAPATARAARSAAPLRPMPRRDPPRRSARAVR